MNEKLRELAVKAQVEHCISHVRLKEFAELIVNECCDQLLKEDIRHGGHGYNQYGLHDKLREHLGVKK
jgi:hypothetical protein